MKKIALNRIEIGMAGGFFLSSLLLSAHATTVNLQQQDVNDASGSAIGGVSSDLWLETGNTYATETAPTTHDGHRFTYWSVDTYPDEEYRNAWGYPLNPISFALLEDTTATAHYLPEGLDADLDGVPDWVEMVYFGSLTNGAAHDGDGDLIPLIDEYTGGTHPLFANTPQSGGVIWADSNLIEVNLAFYPYYTLRSEPSGTVEESAAVPPNTVITTPSLAENAEFGYWALNGVRQTDAWGVAVPQITFTVSSNDMEGVAYLFSGDADNDGIPDAYELYYLGTTDFEGNADPDGDGLTLAQEYGEGSHPLFSNTTQSGGVFWADSELLEVDLTDFWTPPISTNRSDGVFWADSELMQANLAAYPGYTLRSDPPGVVVESAYVPPGTEITTPNMTQSTFGYWTLDGIRQQDAWGVAIRQFSFPMSGTNREAVAYLFSDDSDGDSISDGYEQYYFNSLTNDALSDTDGDGISLLEEYQSGTVPIFGNSSQEGGVFWADSMLVVVNLQHFERPEQLLVAGAHAPFFSPWPDNLTGYDFGTNSAPLLGDWDGDGDLDLFVLHEEGLTAFENTGAPVVMNLDDRSTNFASLSNTAAALAQPIGSIGDINNDSYADLVLHDGNGSLNFYFSAGHFSAPQPSTADFTLSSGSTSAVPALGDFTNDSLNDLMVLLAEGTVDLYPHTGNPSTPYSSATRTQDILGTPIVNGISMTAADVNGDGLLDLLVSDIDGRIWEFHSVAP